MAQRVLTACRDCKNCTNSSFANLGRKLGRGSMGIVTGGISEVAMATRKKCRQCGHQMSLHGVAQANGAPMQAVQVVAPVAPTAPVAPAGPPAGWYADPQNPTAQRWWDGMQWTDHRQPAPPKA